MLIRYFKTNDDYFNFINKYKDKYNIISVKLTSRGLKVRYDTEG